MGVGGGGGDGGVEMGDGGGGGWGGGGRRGGAQGAKPGKEGLGVWLLRAVGAAALMGHSERRGSCLLSQTLLG